MVSNDEDLELFLEDFGKILRKYHYDISPFTLRRITTDGIILGGFSAKNGDGVLRTNYFRVTPKNIKLLEDKDEN